jgi:hypothetical protein
VVVVLVAVELVLLEVLTAVIPEAQVVQVRLLLLQDLL